MLLLDPKTLAPATEQRVILYDVSWEQYEQLSDMFVDEFPRTLKSCPAIIPWGGSPLTTAPHSRHLHDCV
jgi:hypothetical protein